MRLKFKPNVAAPRGTSGSSDAGGAVRGGKSGSKRRSGQREKRLSGGDESGVTGGESASEVETGETSTTKTRRRRRVSSMSSSSTSATHKEVPSLSNDPHNNESDTTAVSNASDSLVKDSSSHSSTSVSNRTTVVDTGTSESRTSQGADVDKPTDLTSRITATVSLVRKPNTSGLSGSSQKNGGGLRMRKKVAPKVVSSRPKRTPSAGTLHDSQLKTVGQEQTTNETAVVSSQESGVTSERTPPSVTRGSNSISPSSTTLRTTRTSRLTKEQSTDEAISSTLNEVLHNTHSHQLADTGLSGIVHPQLNLFTSENSIPELQTDSAIHVSSDVSILSSTTGILSQEEQDKREKNTSTQSQAAIDTMSSTTCICSSASKEASTMESRERTSGVERESVKESNGQVTGGRTSRAGSESGQSRNSRSRTNSICSEVDGRDQTTGKGGRKKRSGTKRQKPSRDSTPCNEGGGDGLTTDSASSTPSKKARMSVAKVREAPDRTRMTMQELIYYNPTANPMSSTAEEKKRRKADGEESRQSSKQGSRASSVQPQFEASLVDNKEGGEIGEVAIEDSERIVPQLRIGDDGNIIVDESSTLMETTEQKPLEDVSELAMFTRHTTSASYRRRYRVTKWSKEETGRFFKALRQVGTDFTMMTFLIPRRSRKELKNKFKKEEKSNPHLISQALKNQYSLQKLKEKK